MATTMRALLAEARRCEVTVALSYLEPPLRGHYDHRTGEIIIDIRLTEEERKEALAHELGHALYRDDCSTPATEKRAWRRAAELLIDVDEYRAAERLDPHPVAIAAELGVTRRIVRIFQKEHLAAIVLRRA